MHWVTVFDLAQSGYKDWWFPAFGLVFVAIGIGLARDPDQSASRRARAAIVAGFGLLWVLVAFLATLDDYERLHSAWEEGRYQIVEGLVENYRFQKAVHFDVKGVPFSYSTSELTAAFNDDGGILGGGGPIYSGLYVRIAYVGGSDGNRIIRLETRR